MQRAWPRRSQADFRNRCPVAQLEDVEKTARLGRGRPAAVPNGKEDDQRRERYVRDADGCLGTAGSAARPDQGAQGDSGDAVEVGPEEDTPEIHVEEAARADAGGTSSRAPRAVHQAQIPRTSRTSGVVLANGRPNGERNPCRSAIAGCRGNAAATSRTRIRPRPARDP